MQWKTHKSVAECEFAINLKHLNVKLEQDSKFIIKDIDIDIKKGQKVAVIGRSGSGKSVFIQALYKLVKAEQDLEYQIF
jgi:ABC-type bacteriocin/lantibiotic exporter with double-glycine peptidase domain